jgi:hypothetical protein
MSSASLNQNCCVWDQYKYSLYRRLNEPKLYRYAAKGEWDLIPARCISNPKEALFVHKYPPQDTALHRLLRTQSCQECNEEVKGNIFEMKKEAVRSLLNCNPAAARTKDSFRRTPLHWGCMDLNGNQASEDLKESFAETSILIMLLDRAPEALSMKDVEQRTPLHYVAARADYIPVSLVAKVVTLCPEVLEMKDEVGESPLQIIESRREEIVNADEIIKTMTMPSPVSGAGDVVQQNP